MKKFLESTRVVWQDKLIGPAIWLSLLIIVFSFSFFIFNFSKLPPEVPLFYSRPWGEEQLALNWQLAILPALSLIIFLVDLILAAKLYSQESLLAQILVWSSTIFSLLTTITLVKIITLIT